MIIKKENCQSWFANALIFCFVLTPTIKIPGFLGVRVDDLLSFLLLFSFFISPRISAGRIKMPLRGLFIFLFSILMLFSILLGAFLSLPASLLDLTKYIWLVKMLTVYVFFFNFIYSHELDLKSVAARRIQLLNTFITVAFISSLICFSQYFNLMGLNAYYIPIIAPTQATTLLGDYSTPRVVGMIGNPNAQGYILALAILALTYLYLIKQKRSNLVIGSTIFVALLMTLSRTSLVITLVGFLSLILLYKRDLKFAFIKFGIIIFLIISSLSLIAFIHQNEVLYNLIFWRFESLSNIMEDKSFITRFEGWAINLEYFYRYPLIGVGPVPRATELFGTADNEWLYFARAYGSIGLIWVFLFFFTPLIFYNATNKVEKNVKRFIFTVIFMTMIYMVPAGIFTSSSLNNLFIVLLAFYDKNIRTLSNNFK